MAVQHEGGKSVSGFDKRRKFVLASEMLKEQGVACGGLVGIGIAFIHDDDGKFVISHSVTGGAAHAASLQTGEILTHINGLPLSAPSMGPSDLGKLLLGYIDMCMI